ncbi:hypothetical protein OEZ86_007972 [Tetradesmus obliquus]|nr:hypothetical protein OEZ86_007972 [Tetradesmus obliquus]
MSDVEGRLSSAFGLLHSSPGAESAQSCVAAALLSWLEHGLKGNRAVSGSVWSVVTAATRAFPIQLSPSVEKAQTLADVCAGTDPVQAWVLQAIDDGSLVTLVQRLRSQPQIITAYTRDALIRDAKAAERLVAQLQQLKELLPATPYDRYLQQQAAQDTGQPATPVHIQTEEDLQPHSSQPPPQQQQDVAGAKEQDSSSSSSSKAAAAARDVLGGWLPRQAVAAFGVLQALQHGSKQHPRLMLGADGIARMKAARASPPAAKLDLWVRASLNEQLLGVRLSTLAANPDALAAAAALEQQLTDIAQLQADAYEAYANRDFQAAVQYLTDILQVDASNPRWLEMRAQVLVDAKSFDAAVADFNAALALAPAGEPIVEARLRAGRALAYEGRSQWQEALADYDAALQLAAAGGESPDPYIINARGNCRNSLGEWEGAREDYLTSSQLFQQAKGFRGRGGTTTQRLDGAIFAASNAALMLAQVGDEEGALREFEKIARRAPGSSDSRAALAALYWRRGDEQRAEDVWHFACENISAGCSKYQDRKWLQEVRRWPPVMVARLQDFLALQRPA